VTEPCPSWCETRHEAGRTAHLRHYRLDARSGVTAILNSAPAVSMVLVHVDGLEPAELAPAEAVHLAAILAARTNSPGVRTLASAMGRAGELLLAAAGSRRSG
jgi:hypothetical protein